MAKKPLRRSYQNLVLITLWISIVSLVVYFYFRYKQVVQPINIMEIAPVDLHYGYTTVSGILQKTSFKDSGDSYTLMLRDLRAIKLDVKGLDLLVGQNVIVTGDLSFSPSTNFPMTMTVSEIRVQ